MNLLGSYLTTHSPDKTIHLTHLVKPHSISSQSIIISLRLSSHQLNLGYLISKNCLSRAGGLVRSSSQHLGLGVVRAERVVTCSADSHWLIQLLPRYRDAVLRTIWAKYLTTAPAKTVKANCWFKKQLLYNTMKHNIIMYF